MCVCVYACVYVCVCVLVCLCMCVYGACVFLQYDSYRLF